MRQKWIGVLYLILGCFFLNQVSASVNRQTLALVVNRSDPESIEIARYYQRVRLIPPANIVYLDFRAATNSLSENEFKEIQSQLNRQVGENIQAYVLAWRKPWRVGCMSITAAFSLGYDVHYCAQGCRLTKASNYFNSSSRQPFTDFAIRPSMLLSADSVQGVRDLINRGLKADYSRPYGTAWLLSTHDKQRNVRAVYYPVIQRSLGHLLDIEFIRADAIKHKKNIMFYFTGSKKVKEIYSNTFLPGAVADHLTSVGGHLFKSSQMSILEWIKAGVTASYGTVVEPCNFLQKFPDPGIVMRKYLSGESILEAYWKSVKMPGQGLFVGEPLASPYKGCVLRFNRLGVAYFARPERTNFVEKSSMNCGYGNFSTMR